MTLTIPKRWRVVRIVALALLAVVVAITILPGRAGAQAGGPVVLINIDAEDGNDATTDAHGGKAPYTSVLNDILNKVTNGGSGILVIGGGKSSTDDVTEFWTIIANNVNQNVVFVNGASNITNKSFAGFSVIGIASGDSINATPSGGLTQAENDALATRANDIANHVNGGGGLLGFTQTDMTNKYAYLGQIGSFVLQAGPQYSDIDATAAGQAVGINNINLDVCCWHDTFADFPDFLSVLAYKANTLEAAAIGGEQVVIPGFTLEPGTANNTVGTPHTVTLEVSQAVGGARSPVPNVTGNFAVSGANTASGSCVTNANGKCNFTYTGTNVGTDTINAAGTVARQPQTATADKTWTPPPFIPVAIDIKPTSCPNPLNVKNRGVLPVAILGSASFNVRQIDPRTVRLAGVPALRWSLQDVAGPFTGTIHKPPKRDDCTTQGPDRFTDLTLKIHTQTLVSALGSVSDGDVLILRLTGKLRDGTDIKGRDVVWIRKKGRSR